MRILLLLLTTFLLIACTPTLGPASPEVPAAPRAEAAPDTLPLEGWWLLSEFHDSILVHQRIGRYRMPIPVWTALALHIGPDSLELYGSIWEARRFPRHGGDTLLSADNFGPVSILREPMKSELAVVWSNELRHGLMHYRRLQQDEMFLVDSLTPGHQKWRFRQNYHAHLLRTFFVGHFLPLDPGLFSFRIDDEGRMTGHPQWTDFYFHDYFGTMHPFEGDVDALSFRDPGLPPQDQVQAFHWRYSGDTLILVPMTGDGDRYQLGKGEYRYLRTFDK